MKAGTALLKKPGSLFLFGEYSILAGGRALVAPVDRYGFLSTDDATKTYTVIGTEASDALPTAVCNTAHAHRSVLDSVQVDISELNNNGTKLGLGSSAVSCALLADLLAPNNAVEVACIAHRAFQNGRGSCADVICSVMAELVAVSAYAGDPRFNEIDTRIKPSTTVWPDRLAVVPVWTSAPAKTTSFVAALEKASQKNAPEVMQLLTRLNDISRTAIQDFATDGAQHIVELASDANETLGELGEVTCAPIVIDAHRSLVSNLPAGFAAKPSGAGGGDFSLIFGLMDSDWDSALASIPTSFQDLGVRFTR